jgi:hypothetical protein
MLHAQPEQDALEAIAHAWPTGAELAALGFIVKCWFL